MRTCKMLAIAGKAWFRNIYFDTNIPMSFTLTMHLKCFWLSSCAMLRLLMECLYACLSVCTSACLRVCMSAFLCVSTCVRACLLSVCMCVCLLGRIFGRRLFQAVYCRCYKLIFYGIITQRCIVCLLIAQTRKDFIARSLGTWRASSSTLLSGQDLKTRIPVKYQADSIHGGYKQHTKDNKILWTLYGCCISFFAKHACTECWWQTA